MDNFIKDIKENKFRNIYYFYGNERYLIDFYLKKAEKAALPEKTEGIDFDLVNYQDSSIGQIISNANTNPFLGDKKIILVKNADLLSKEKQLSPKEFKIAEEYIKNPNPSCILFFLGEEEIKNISKNKLALILKSSSSGRLVESKKLKGQELKKWIESYLVANEVKISPGAMEILLMIGEKGLYNLHNELEKLILFTNGELITEEEVRDLITLTPEGKIFELTDAVISKQGKKALTLVDEYFAAREQPIVLRSMLISSFRRMIIIKNALQEGYMKPVYKDYLDTGSDFLIDKTVRQVKNISLEELLAIYDELYNLEFTSRNSKQDQALLVKDFIIKTVF
jgi:DNA polymerase-3 subunit delta